MSKLYLGLGERIGNVTKSLSEVFDSALPEFLKAREKALRIDYNNILTAATFFSAVTATTLQLSYAYNTGTRASLGVAVNTLWFIALVFSTASSLNSLVGLTWYQKIRRDQTLPDWVKLWIEYGPTISLAVASASFSAGLCLFAFSSSQHIITSALTATFTIAHAVALFVPLCLYSPNWLSRFLLKVFGYCKQVCLRQWYLRRVSWEDRARVVRFIRREDAPRSGVDNICNLSGIDLAQTSSTRAKRIIKIAGTSALSSSRSIVGWLITRCSHWLALSWPMIRDPKESSNMEQTHEANAKVATPSELERGNGLREHAEEPEMQILTVTDGRGISPSEGLQISTPNATDPDQNAALAADGSGEEAGRSFDTHPTQELTKEPVATISSTTNPIYGPGSRLKVQNSDNDLEDVERQETDAPKRLNQLQEEQREGAEENNFSTSNYASGVGRGREGIVQEGRD